jgi:2-keto-4-pentenoate hydratase/2-oxohepta-3-ene-1,7-dioic acid hydratase in catechol pathway
MKLVSFGIGARSCKVGILTGDEVIDVAAVLQHHGGDGDCARDMRALISASIEGRLDLKAIAERAPATAIHDLAAVRLDAPIMPSTILCAGSNYRAHNSEKANTPLSGKEPEFFVKTSDSVVGPNGAILFDAALTQKLDCETELAVVIGKPGRHIPVKSALDHVFGYTIVNDVTARDRQVRTASNGTVWYELGRGKAFDTSAPLGPVIVTADEIRDPQSLQISTRINGELRQHSATSDMIWTCADLIHFFSVNFTLRPGMVIITGSPAGTAWSADRELGGVWTGEQGLVRATRYCLPGDIVECHIDRIGTLRNHIEATIRQ